MYCDPSSRAAPWVVTEGMLNSLFQPLFDSETASSYSRIPSQVPVNELQIFHVALMEVNVGAELVSIIVAVGVWPM